MWAKVRQFGNFFDLMIIGTVRKIVVFENIFIKCYRKYHEIKNLCHRNKSWAEKKGFFLSRSIGTFGDFS
jgi:hypothetical protein